MVLVETHMEMHMELVCKQYIIEILLILRFFHYILFIDREKLFLILILKEKMTIF